MRNKLLFSCLAVCGVMLACSALPGGSASAAEAEPEWCTKANLIRLDGAQTEQVQTYKAAPSRFLCGSLLEKTGDRLWTGTLTGGTTEPDVNNFDILSYSDDEGKTWTDVAAIDNLTYPDKTRVYDSDLWTDPDGRLWIFYNQTAETWAPAGVMPSTAHFAVILENPTADPSEFTFKTTEMLFGGQSRCRPLVIEVNGKEQWLKASHMNWTEYTEVWASDDKGETWYKKGQAKGVACGAHENSIVELSDHTLMMVKRIDSGINGGIEVSYSSNQGKTWSPYENNLLRPLRGPGSKSVMINLASGALLFVTNDTNNGQQPSAARNTMTAFLSTDDGTTWPYRLVVDARTDVSYPDAFQAEDGTIYVTWDKGRTNYCETRFCAFTEEDIKRGSFGEDSIYMRPIYKGSNFADIVSFERFGGIPSSFPLGVAHDVVASSQLTDMTITTSNGMEYDIHGTWASADYDPNTPGSYWFYFTPDSLPQRVEDNQKVLKVKITVLDTAEPVAVSLTVTPPAKTAYKVGEAFDPAGLAVKATFSDGGKKTLEAEEYTLSGFDSSTAGEKTVTVRYGGLETSFTVTVTGSATDPTTPGGTEEPSGKKGCKGSVALGGAVLLAAAVAGMAVVIRKKKD